MRWCAKHIVICGGYGSGKPHNTLNIFIRKHFRNFSSNFPNHRLLNVVDNEFQLHKYDYGK